MLRNRVVLQGLTSRMDGNENPVIIVYGCISVGRWTEAVSIHAYMLQGEMITYRNKENGALLYYSVPTIFNSFTCIHNLLSTATK